MKKNYYLFNPGRMSRKDNTLKFVATDDQGNEQPAKYIPIEGIAELFVFGSLDANSALYNFLGKQQVPVHFFDYYEHYTGSFMPREYLQAGRMQVEQTRHFLEPQKRIELAQRLVEGAAFNMVKNLRYYHNRDADLEAEITTIETLTAKIPDCGDVSGLMGIEGNIRQLYYSTFEIILKDFSMNGRSKRPPKNEVNTLISFGNMLCYALCLSTIYHTQLNPTISFLHDPGARRYSLALDIAEIFKPILVDRTIFKVLNKKMVQAKDFDLQTGRCTLKESGRKAFIRAWEERLEETIQHRSLKKKVSYKYLVRLECYKLSKHVMGIQEYRPFKIWW